MRTSTARLLLSSILAGCGPTMGTDPPSCDDPVVAEACDDEFCGDPIVRAATGDAPERFALLGAEPRAGIHFGSQGGYHIYGGMETENLCSVVFLTFRLLVAPDATIPAEEHTEILRDQRHIQALRCDRLTEPSMGTGVTAEFCEDRPSLQRWWGAELRFSCAYWPLDNDPNHQPFCGEEAVGHIEDMHVLLEVVARDHDERTVTETVEVEPFLSVPPG